MDLLLTIAIPTYNRINFLKRALDSILVQYDKRVEILVSDNCSEDGTDILMLEYQIQYSFIRYIKNKENIGVDGNFLQCLRNARGKYIWLLGSDDVVTENAINKIISCIERYDYPLFFMNHIFFQNKYTKFEYYQNAYIKEIKNQNYTYNKNEFINITKDRLSYMSSLLISKFHFDRIKKPEKYIGTWFIHTCIALEVSKTSDLLGIVPYPCVADDTTPLNSEFSAKPELNFHVFGERMKFVFCTIGEQCGFNIDQMKNVHKNWIIKRWPFYIINMKAKYGDMVKDAFWENGYESVKEYREIWFTVIPSLYIPQFIAKMIVKYIKPIYKKLRN